MQVLAFNHFSPPRYAYVSLYNTVNDPGSLKKRIIAASKAGPEEQAAVNFSFVDASLVRPSDICCRSNMKQNETDYKFSASPDSHTSGIVGRISERVEDADCAFGDFVGVEPDE